MLPISKYFATICLVLLLLPAAVVAADDVLTGQAEANRFLSAEVTRSMNAAKADIIQEVNNNNDLNFAAFDTRMTQFMSDTKMKTVLAAIGASLIATGIAAFFMMRTFKNYSYEMYQDKIIKQQKKEIDAGPAQMKGIDQMQQSSWRPQEVPHTLGVQYGQEFASQATQMNAWQAQAAYGGAWQAPVQVERDYVQRPWNYQEPQNYDQFQPQQEQVIRDPMQSPGWDPQRGGY